MSSSNLVPLTASEKSIPVGKWLGAAASDTHMEVTLGLRSKNDKLRVQFAYDVRNGKRKPLTRSQFHRKFGASQADIQQVLDFASAHDLTITDLVPGERRIRLAGTAAQMSAAFAVELHRYQQPDGVTYLGRRGTIMLPAHLDGIVKYVRNLDTRPQANNNLRRLLDEGGMPVAAHASAFNPSQIAAARNVPGNHGKGQAMAFIELGGGFRMEDLIAYWKAQNVPVQPSVTAFSVDGATNSPTTADGADGEVMADICVSSAIAYLAKFGVYFGQNTSDGFINVLSTAVHDETFKASVVSGSWGAAKDNFTSQDVQAFIELGQDAATMGVTILFASGDDGSNDNMNDGKTHVDWPSACEWILSCGGTRYVNGVSTVWGGIPNNGAGGGGVDPGTVPTYQQSYKNLPVNADTQEPGRVTPDLADVADPQTGWNVRVDGENMVIGGTSLVAPFAGAAIICVNAAVGTPVGFVHTKLYQAGLSVTTDVTKGSNGAYSAEVGIDACSGLGVVDWGKFTSYLQSNN